MTNANRPEPQQHSPEMGLILADRLLYFMEANLHPSGRSHLIASVFYFHFWFHNHTYSVYRDTAMLSTFYMAILMAKGLSFLWM